MHGMVFVWSYLTKGDAAYTLVQVAVNDLIILVAFAPIVALSLGVGGVAISFFVPMRRSFFRRGLPLTRFIVLRNSQCDIGHIHLLYFAPPMSERQSGLDRRTFGLAHPDDGLRENVGEPGRFLRRGTYGNQRPVGVEDPHFHYPRVALASAPVGIGCFHRLGRRFPAPAFGFGCRK